MEGEHQGIQFHQVLVAHGMIEDEPEGDQGGAHGVGSDEYTYTYYEFDGTDDNMEEERGTDEASVTPPTGET